MKVYGTEGELIAAFMDVPVPARTPLYYKIFADLTRPEEGYFSTDLLILDISEEALAEIVTAQLVARKIKP